MTTQYHFDDADVKELIECRENFQYFALKYFNIKNTLDFPLFTGFTDLRTFKPTMEEVKVFLVWYALFQYSMLIVITSDLQENSKTILADVMKMIESLPHPLQMGFVERTKLRVKFENDNRIICTSCNSCSCRGMTVSLCIAFNSDKIKPKNLSDFLNGALPMIQSISSSKLILL